LRGFDGEMLAMDVARLGAADARSLLLVSSGCHGVEGFCGSAVQRALLADAGFIAQAQRGGVALLFVHALNPHGFSFWRRPTHENVDLNRNWHDFAAPLPANPGYEALAHAIVPPTWPPAPALEAQLAAYGEAHGAMALQQAVTGGQHTHPEGLFYGGRNPTWSQQTLRQVLREHAQRCARLGWIDLHTGLGPTGHGERILASTGDPQRLQRARAWWGPGVTAVDEGSSSSAPLTGLMWTVAGQECPQAEYTGIAMEYGTVPLPEMLRALRGEQWAWNHPEADPALRAALRQACRDAFCVDTPAWKAQVVAQGLAVARQAVAALAG
jgi:hypothetical protein